MRCNISLWLSIGIPLKAFNASAFLTRYMYTLGKEVGSTPISTNSAQISPPLALLLYLTNSSELILNTSTIVFKVLEISLMLVSSSTTFFARFLVLDDETS